MQVFGELGTRPLLGYREIPFLLRTSDDGDWIRGIEHKPANATDRNVTREITPGAARVEIAYVLLVARNAWRAFRHGCRTNPSSRGKRN